VTDDRSARLSELAQGPSPTTAAVHEASAALRELIGLVVASNAPVETIQEVAEVVRVATERLQGFPRGNYIFSEASMTGDPRGFFDNSPVAGLGNPLAPPLHMRVEGDTIVADVVWGAAYEGPPGCCHGGHVAAAFDDVLGLAQDLSGQSGMTGTLTVRYRRPTPLHQQNRFVARIDRVEGRKIFTTGELYDPDGNVLAEGEAVFIAIDFGKMRELVAKRDGEPPAES
jgi:acyl-coenzyme A thioesterase PaaI-like protein